MKFVFSKLNAVILIIAILVIITGYVIMGTGDNTISPILLIISYVVLFPLAIMIGSEKKGTKDSKK